ncbi:MAG: hypothetical protein ABI831_24130 [Betaproteobacteria bacterium]
MSHENATTSVRSGWKNLKKSRKTLAADIALAARRLKHIEGER